VVAGIALVAAVALGLWFRSRAIATARPAPPSLEAAERLYKEAVEHGKNGRFSESLANFEKAAQSMIAVDWVYHHDYSSTLNNVTMQVDSVHGIPVPAIRTSIQRVRLVRRSLEEMNLAQRTATTGPERSIVHRARAQTLQVWGFPWEALGDLQAAHHFDTTRHDFTRAADSYLYRMQHPVRPDSLKRGGPVRVSATGSP
jgi:hypothetical protein